MIGQIFRRTAFVAVALILLMSACSPIDVANTLTSKSGYSIEQDVAYGDDPRQSMDVYRPHSIAPDAPIVLFFYGGRWQFGSKEDYLFFGQALAENGIISMIADYRLYPQVRWRGFIEDAGAALAKAVELADGRPVVLAGHSAGAHLAAMAALDDNLQASNNIDKCAVKGLVGLAGPFDFLPLREADIIEVFGPGTAGPDTQPISFATANDPPALLIHGADDTTVVPGNSSRLALAMEAAGNPAQTRIYDGVGHIGLIASFAWPARFWSPALLDMVAFLNQLPKRDDC